MFTSILAFAHQLLKETVKKGETVVDATCGNGNDTLFLSNLVGDTGKVYAFDVQQAAIESTKQLLNEANRANVTLIHDGHEHMKKYLPTSLENKLGGAIFNLGYLPRSDKTIITKSASTIAAIESLLPFIRKGARISIVIYHGHEGGAEERDDVLSYVRSLDQNKYAVISYQFINQKNNPPFVVAIEKL